jgi:hypothetical protein
MLSSKGRGPEHPEGYPGHGGGVRAENRGYA